MSSFHADLVGMRTALKARATFLLQNDSAADDLVQDTLERALSNRHMFRTGSNLAAWTGSIMRNLFVDRWCRAARTTCIDSEQPSVTADETKDIGPLDLIKASDVEMIIATLPERQRDIFKLFHLDHLSQREIAIRFGLPINTVASRLFRARHKLRRSLERVWADRRADVRHSG